MFSVLSRRLMPSQLCKARQPHVRFNSVASRKVFRPEYFISVWHKKGIDKKGITVNAKDFPASFHLVGEMLDQNTLDVCGNCLACVCTSEEEALHLLQLTPYFKKGIWDMSTAKVSALETVHTSDLMTDPDIN